ncbi:MAG: hypothetical protein WDW36_010078 [Sanguina aurantia]
MADDTMNDGMSAAAFTSAAQPPPPTATSRLCVKNFPKYVDEARLREHFAAKGDVTDVKIMRTRKILPGCETSASNQDFAGGGESRQLGFIGFRTVAQAEGAHTYFDRSYMDTLRLGVEFARAVGDQSMARPWSRYSDGSSAHDAKVTLNSAAASGSKAAGGVAVQEASAAAAAAAAEAQQKRKSARGPLAVDEAAADPKFAEFMALMAPRGKTRLWSNDEVLANNEAVLLQPGARPPPGGRRGGCGGRRHSSGEVETSEGA